MLEVNWSEGRREGKGKPFWTRQLHGKGMDGRVTYEWGRSVLSRKRDHVGHSWEKSGSRCGKIVTEDFVVRAVKGSYRNLSISMKFLNSFILWIKSLVYNEGWWHGDLYRNKPINLMKLDIYLLCVCIIYIEYNYPLQYTVLWVLTNVYDSVTSSQSSYRRVPSNKEDSLRPLCSQPLYPTLGGQWFVFYPYSFIFPRMLCELNHTVGSPLSRASST